jgi:hypothetical protein
MAEHASLERLGPYALALAFATIAATPLGVALLGP